MCRNITTLRGLEPPATAEEIEAAARQFVRKISGVTRPSAATGAPIDKAVRHVAAAATALLAELPARRQPPATVPPLRRPEVQARLARREERPSTGDRTAGPAARRVTAAGGEG